MNQRIANAGFSHNQNNHKRALPWCGTFHSLAMRFLSLNGDENFAIIDEADSQDLLFRILKEQNEPIKKKEITPIRATISYSRNSGEDLMMVGKDKLLPPRHLEKIDQWFQDYTKRKKEQALKDFDDLLVDWQNLLQQEVNKGNHYFDYILVDEYQDTNHLQDTIIDTLAKMTNNIMVVGDDAQSIYGFRGSCVENILSFTKRYPESTIIRLEENYRSSQAILNLSNALWETSNAGIQKKLRAFNKLQGEKPLLQKCKSEQEQVTKVIQSITKSHRQGINYRNQAILFRSAFHAIKLEMELRKNKIPYKKFGGKSIADAAHTKDLQAILRAICSRCDEPAWIRMLNLLKGVGEKTATRIFNKVKTEQDTNPFHSLTTKELLLIEPFKELFSVIDLFGDSQKPEDSPRDLIQNAIEKYLPILEKNYDNADQRAKELETFAVAATEYQSLREFLNAFFLDEDDNTLAEQEDTDYLTLTTVHSAKGLEWEKVIIIQLIDKAFPSTKSIENGELEEELRLMYVAFTRAKQTLQLYWPETSLIHSSEGWHTTYNQISLFLNNHNIQKQLKNAINPKTIKRNIYDYSDGYYYDYEDL
jgi:DNA helicase-2/ATP-dependent DNA helicase PcrA